jgi:predicted O-methyltransferase YrrM
LKPQSFFEMYDRFLAGRTPERVLEVGVFQGGSGLLFADKWPGARISGLDLQPRNDAVQRHAVRFGFSDRLKFYYGVSQADERAVLRIIDQDLDGSPDVVIDDASHLYPLTKRTFEIVFPRLARGGVYIIEDWAWGRTGMATRRLSILGGIIWR